MVHRCRNAVLSHLPSDIPDLQILIGLDWKDFSRSDLWVNFKVFDMLAITLIPSPPQLNSLDILQRVNPGKWG